MSADTPLSIEQLRAAAEAAGFVLVPKDPPPGLLMSVALRMDHALGCPGYYDNLPGGHARRLERTISDARRAHEEITGAGFWSPEREAMYVAMQAEACKAGKS